MINLTKLPIDPGTSQQTKAASGKDLNVCEHCNLYVPTNYEYCPNCEQVLVLKTTNKISIWRLGEIRDGVLGHLAAGLKKAFHAEVTIQPTFLDERPSARPKWRGISSSVFLNQVHRRHTPGTFICLGVTESNIVPDSRHNFLFGYAYMGLPASVVSLHALSHDEPSPDLLVQRFLKIANHEIGHNLGLDHHSYDEGVNCVMVGDVEVDSLETVDQGSANFCAVCGRAIANALGSFGASMAGA